MNSLIIHDKFNIIGDYNSEFTTKELNTWIANIFNNNDTCWSNDIIHQFIYNEIYLNKQDEMSEIIKVIDKTIEKQIVSRTKNIVPLIRKNKFTLNDMENSLISMLDIIKKINDTLYLINRKKYDFFNLEKNGEFVRFYWGMSVIYQLSLKHIFSKFIDNCIIKKFFDSHLTLLDDDIQPNIKAICAFMYRIKSYDNGCYDYFTKNLVKNLESLMNIDNNIKLPINMGIFSKFNNYNFMINNYKKISEYYDFIDNNTKENLKNTLIANISDILLEIYNKNYSKSQSNIIMNFSMKNIDNIKLVWDSMKKSENNYNKNNLNNSVTQFVNTSIENLIPECNTIKGFNNFIQLFDSCINLIEIFEEEDYMTSLNNKFNNNLRKIISSNDKFIDIMCTIINKKLKEVKEVIVGNDTNHENIVTSCTNTLKLLNFVNNKDVFYAKYCNFLVQRLLNGTDLSIERNMIDNIQEIQDYTYVRKLHKMIDDILISNESLKNYNSIKINQYQGPVTKNKSESRIDNDFRQNKLSLITFSHNIWDISINKYSIPNEAINSFPEQLRSYLLTYNTFYKKKFPNKNLNWLLEMGIIDVSMDFAGKKYNLKVTPYQMIVIEMFNDKTMLSMGLLLDKLSECTGIKKDSKILDNVIKSLLISGLFLKRGTFIIFKKDFSVKNENISLIDYYNNVSSYDISVEKQIEKQITLDREIIVQANIINLLKITNMSVESLYSLLQENLQQYFEFDKSFLMKNLDCLMKKDYIDHKNDEFQYLLL